MTMPTSQCPWRMQVHHIHQETPDVWTLSLLCHDYYPYRAGQYALVSVRNSADTLRAYTISSTPGVSEYITLTVRRIDDGAGSQWLTRDVKRGDYIWLSDAQGDFTCDDKADDKFLLLAAGCGVNDLPLSLVLSWFEQKAIVILLTLLSLGVTNIVTGPTAPGFLTPDLLAVLNEKFGLLSVTNVEDDMKQLLSA